MTTTASRSKILGATAAAAAIAAVALVTVVLPAEYGIDPLRTGRALGLTAMSDSAASPAPVAPKTGAASPNSPESGQLKQDVLEVELRPYEGMEYKYAMEKGASMVYSGTASDTLEFEFHGEPAGAAKGYFDSYEKSKNRESHGSFVAPATGIHGWYWNNNSAKRVTLRLVTNGFYGNATEFRDGDRIVHTVTVR